MTYYNYGTTTLTVVPYNTFKTTLVSGDEMYSETYGEAFKLITIGGEQYAVIDESNIGKPSVVQTESVNCLTDAVEGASIKKKSVKLTVTVLDNRPLTKPYDGTTDVITPDDKEGLYYVPKSDDLPEEKDNYSFAVSLSGLTFEDLDEIEFNSLEVVFNDAKASSLSLDRTVIFTINELIGQGSENYTIENAKYSLSATITKKEINVKLANSAITETAKLNEGATVSVTDDVPYVLAHYGDNFSQATYFYEYTFVNNDGDNVKTYTTGNGKFYDNLDDAYNALTDETVVFKTADEIGLYDSLVLPTAYTTCNSFSNAGIYGLTLRGGEATNYKFVLNNSMSTTATYNYDYTTVKAGAQSNSNNVYELRQVLTDYAGALVVQRKVAYAYTNSAGRIYGASDAEVPVMFSSSAFELNTSGLANGQLNSSITGITLRFVTTSYTEGVGYQITALPSMSTALQIATILSFACMTISATTT